jgi:hypothetical protein
MGQKDKEFRNVSKSANQFIELFHRTLDFGAGFDKLFLPNTVEKMREINFFQSFGLNSELEATADKIVLENFYKANMNYYYLNGLYGLSKDGNEIPSEILKDIKSTKFANKILNADRDDIVISTTDEIKQFTAELNSLANLYRKYIPKGIFNSKMYKTKLKKLTIKQSPSLQILDGYDDFKIKKGTKVYYMEKDLFIFYFVKQNGKFKVLTLGIGN